MEQKRKQIRIFQDKTYKELGNLYGLFFEDINHAADGGLYAEMVQNRSFEYCHVDRKEYHALTAWGKKGRIDWEIRSETPMCEENPHYLHVEAKPGGAVYNRGYNTGIYVEAGKKYDFSLYVRNEDDSVRIRVTVETPADAEEETPVSAKKADADSEEGKAACSEEEKDAADMKKETKTIVNAEGEIIAVGAEWKKYELQLQAGSSTTCGRLVLTFEAGGSCDIDMVSLFPQDTFLGKKGGLRKDIAETLRQMRPKFMRFPGGCLVHDGSLNDRDRNSMYRWKRTIGRVEERPSRRNNWKYNQTLGLGYFEYFCFCEEIGAEPVPILPGGFNPHTGAGAAVEELGEWVSDALDLIEFANGSADSGWGRIRKELGHEAPFHLKYIGIGNEEVGDGFFERYPYFHRAIREKYPEIKIINTAGPFSAGESYEAGWRSARKYGSDLVDEHYYCSPEWYLANMHHYEDYDENGPKVFLGEYASCGNTYYNALIEAAYMTHLERSKAAAMACYAPMLCNADYVNWRPNLIWFNNHSVMRTPNYYVQKLFMENQGTDAVLFETEHLEEIISLMDEKNITGGLTAAGNDIEGEIWGIRLEDYETGKTAELPDILIGGDNKENPISDVNSGHYKLSFRFRRTAGRKGLKICFGRKDERNKLCWEFGGWDNWDCNLDSVYGGRSSVISHRIFRVEDKEYFLELEINGRKIRTWVNGELYNDTSDRLPQLEELYVTAGVDRHGDKTILKAVNLTGEEKEVRILLEGKRKNGVKISCLKGHGLGDANTLGEPEQIVPKEEWRPVTENALEYLFAPHSVTIFSFEE